MKKQHMKKGILGASLVTALVFGANSVEGATNDHVTPCEIITSQVANKNDSTPTTLSFTQLNNTGEVDSNSTELVTFQQKFLRSKFFRFQELLLSQLKTQQPRTDNKVQVQKNDDTIETNSAVLEVTNSPTNITEEQPQETYPIATPAQQQQVQDVTWTEEPQQEVIQQVQNEPEVVPANPQNNPWCDGTGQGRHNQDNSWCDGTGQGRHNQNHDNQNWHNGNGHHRGRR